MTEEIQTDEQEQTMRELLRVAASIYAGMGEEKPIKYEFTRVHIPVLRPSERIRVILIREHDDPPVHPLPVADAVLISA